MSHLRRVGRKALALMRAGSPSPPGAAPQRAAIAVSRLAG